MAKCLLCQEREATKKGSHIIPSFIMKRINSIDSCNERDYELGFTIGPGTVESYFGRNVYEDRRREFTDEESRIEDRTNLDTMDNVFCPVCEKLFSKYEGKYSSTYQLQYDDNLMINNTKLTGAEAALFWYSVIWRISSTGKFGVRLCPAFEEKLRNSVLSEDINGTDIYYALHYCKDYRSQGNATAALFDSSDNVALLIVDEFMIVIFDGTEAVQNNKVLWGINFKYEVSKLNNGTVSEKIAGLPINVFKCTLDYILRQVVNRIDFKGKFNSMHKNLFGFDMPATIFQELMTEVYKAKLADRYTVNNYALAMKRVIQTHPEMYRIRFVD